MVVSEVWQVPVLGALRDCKETVLFSSLSELMFLLRLGMLVGSKCHYLSREPLVFLTTRKVWWWSMVHDPDPSSNCKIYDWSSQQLFPHLPLLVHSSREVLSSSPRAVDYLIALPIDGRPKCWMRAGHREESPAKTNIPHGVDRRRTDGFS